MAPDSRGERGNPERPDGRPTARGVEAIVAEGRVYAPGQLDGLRLRIVEHIDK